MQKAPIKAAHSNNYVETFLIELKKVSTGEWATITKPPTKSKKVQKFMLRKMKLVGKTAYVIAINEE